MKYFTPAIVCAFITTCVLLLDHIISKEKNLIISKAIQLGFIFRLTLCQSIFKLQVVKLRRKSQKLFGFLF